MDEKITLRGFPKITRIDLNFKDGDAIDKNKKNTVELGSSFTVPEKGVVVLVLKQDVKFKMFDLLLEIKVKFIVEPLEDKTIIDNKEFQVKLINRILPYACEIVAYLTGKMGLPPLILPPIFEQEEASEGKK